MSPPRLAVALGLVALPWSGVLGQQTPVVSQEVYEGWRQYSVHCARCHGQDVLGNPVTANLLETVAPGGPTAAEDAFTAVVIEGRRDRGMPGFKDQMTPEQVAAVYLYVRGRAERRIPPGRPRRADG